MIPQSAPPGPPRTPSPQNFTQSPGPTNDSPVHLKNSVSNSNRAQQLERDQRFFLIAGEMKTKFYGPVDPQIFLETFLGPAAFQKRVPRSPWNATVKKAFEDVPVQTENLMYIPLVNSVVIESHYFIHS